MTQKVVILSQAASDLEDGIDFYDRIEAGVGAYFRDSLISDIRRLGVYCGKHAIHFGYHRALSGRFPFAIYYRDQAGVRQVVAVLDMRRNPSWIREELGSRDR